MKTKGEHIKQLLKSNKQIKQKDLIKFKDGSVDWICEHGFSHPIWDAKDIYDHKCDGCCKHIK